MIFCGKDTNLFSNFKILSKKNDQKNRPHDQVADFMGHLTDSIFDDDVVVVVSVVVFPIFDIATLIQLLHLLQCCSSKTGCMKVKN